MSVWFQMFSYQLVFQGKNQVDTFLEQHRGPGIQHIGLYTTDIVRTAQTMAQAGVEFFTPPPAYYTEVCSICLFLTSPSRRLLVESGISLDGELFCNPVQVIFCTSGHGICFISMLWTFNLYVIKSLQSEAVYLCVCMIAHVLLCGRWGNGMK